MSSTPTPRERKSAASGNWPTRSSPKLRDPLLRLLQKDEAVVFVCRTHGPLGAVDQFFGGLYAYHQALSVLVFTNRRVLHLKIKSNGDWKRILRFVPWSAVAGGEVKGLLGKQLELRFRNATSETYWKFRHADASKIKAILRPVLEAAASEPNTSQGMASICAQCFAPLNAKVYTCGQCGLSFKDEKTLLWRAILIPGGGLFYTGQWGLGILSAIYESIWLVMLFYYLLAAVGVVSLAGPGQPVPTTDDILSAAVGMIQALGIEKLLHWYHSLRVVRDFMPAGPPQAGSAWTAPVVR